MQRHIGLPGAIGIGVGAIVGGGILALAGVAFAITGPGALAAFGLNGIIAILTALSFAELSSSFPESGGTYTFAKKLLSVRAAFLVGWVVWFASIVAGVLYAIGFGSFAAVALEQFWTAVQGEPSGWITSAGTVTFLAIAATAFYTLGLLRRTGGGTQWINIAKVLVFALLILGGLWALAGKPVGEIQSSLSPFFPAGGFGLIQAMGYTFIALQGFDLIAAVGGEIRDPARNIPRAMIISLGIALAIYLPLLFIVLTVGMEPGESIVAAAGRHPETIIAVAAEHYLGAFGYWLVIVAAIFSMLSALQANLLASSRIAFSMGRDRTLSYQLEGLDARRGTPWIAVLATALIISTILLVIPNVAAAGAASSLIFLVTFALVHGIGILARRRADLEHTAFRTPLFPLVPIVGLLACFGLALFQGIIVPEAGLITLVWLGFGGFLYLLLFSRRARVVDASAEALNPHLTKLRGKSPLVLVPIANPSSAEALVGVAHALAPPRIGRVLMLSVVPAPEQSDSWDYPRRLLEAQAVLRQSFIASHTAGLTPEALTTVATQPSQEIIRVSRTYRCESILLGFSKLTAEVVSRELEHIAGAVDCDVVVLRAPQSWRLSQVERVLVAVGGQGVNDSLRARILGSIRRTGAREISYLRVMPKHTSREALARSHQELVRFAREEGGEGSTVQVVRSDNVVEEIGRHALDADLLILGLQRKSPRKRVFGDVSLSVAQKTNCGIVMILRR